MTTGDTGQTVTSKEAPPRQETDLRQARTTSSLIASDIAEQKQRRERLGKIDTAVCTTVDRPSEGVVEFHYELPDGSIEPLRFDISEQMEALTELMDEHDVDHEFPGDMKGSEYSCQFDSDGWHLCSSVSGPTPPFTDTDNAEVDNRELVQFYVRAAVIFGYIYLVGFVVL